MGFLTALVYVLMSIVVGAIMVGIGFKAVDLTLQLHYPVKLTLFSSAFDFYSNFIFFCGGILIILFCVRYIQYVIRHSRRINLMEGNLTITISAIEDLIKRMLEEKKELLHVKPKVIFNKAGVTVIIRSDLNANVNLYSLNRVIQEQVKEKVQSLLGDEPDITIKLEIRKMTVINNKKGQERPEPEIPFRYY